MSTIIETPPNIEKRPSIAPDRHDELMRFWKEPNGFWGWLRCVHHTTIGKRFMVTAFIMFLLGGILAMIMRIQLARPDNHFIDNDFYNQVFTMHGSTMMFLFAVPMMFEALSVYLVPLMVGNRNIALPRLNAFSYYIYVGGCLLLWIGFLLNIGPDVGWFAYVPLSGPDFTPGKRADIWAQMITFTELSALCVAVEIACTVFRFRAPGMSLNRIPIFVWGALIVSFMVIFAMPAVMLSSTLLIMDRLVGTHIYNPAEGGDALLYQHLFWFFAHPEVYIIFIPGTAIVSTIVHTFSRRRVFGYTAIVVSMFATGFAGFGVWVHHMFATGLPQLSENFFTAASLMITIPTAVQMFCWLATLWGGKPVVKVPLMWVLGFIFNFMIGGLTGLVLGAVPTDLQVHDTYFVVAHLHYVLIGGAVFPLFGALYYWMPKITGRMMSETAGKWNFWTFFIGFNMVFFPMHILGLRGMPRRVYTYPGYMNWGGLNHIETIGAGILGVSVLIFIGNFFWSLRNGRVAGNNPWGASTLEWSTSSPPPDYNFLDLPTVSGHDTLWENSPDQPIVRGTDPEFREVLCTKALDADPDHRQDTPFPSIWPFWAFIAVTGMFIGSIFAPSAVAWGAIPITFTLIMWFWPVRARAERRRAKEKWSVPA